MWRMLRFLITFFSVLSVIGCVARFVSPPETMESLVHKHILTLEGFNEQWNIIVNEHPSALPNTPEARLACFEKMLIAGIESCLDDRFSHYLSREEMATTYDSIRGLYAGIGLQLIDAKTSVEITSIIENSPAKRSGKFQVGDVVIEVNGEDVSKKSTKIIVAKVRGPAETEVAIRVQRMGKKLDSVTLIREDIRILSVHAFDIDEDITYIKIDSFNRLTPADFAREMASRLLVTFPNGEQFFNLDAKKFIFDLRGNPGGILEAVGMMSYLFANGNDHIVIIEQSRKGEEIHRARDFVSDTTTVPVGIFREVDVVVIIDEASASAAEIFVAFVHEATGAPRVGKKSYGKGSIQKIFPLEQEDALSLTIAEYFVGNQRIRINKIGIQPEYEVDNPKPDKEIVAGIRINPEKDPQLKKAIELLRAPHT